MYTVFTARPKRIIYLVVRGIRPFLRRCFVFDFNDVILRAVASHVFWGFAVLKTKNKKKRARPRRPDTGASSPKRRCADHGELRSKRWPKRSRAENPKTSNHKLFTSAHTRAQVRRRRRSARAWIYSPGVSRTCLVHYCPLCTV